MNLISLDHLDEIWHYMNRPRQCWLSSDIDDFHQSIKGINTTEKNPLKFFKKHLSSENKSIWIKEVNSNDKEILDDLGISIEKLCLSLRLSQAKKSLNTSNSTEIEIPVDYQKSYGDSLRSYQEEVLSNRCLSVVCPFSGEIIKSIHSFPIGRSLFYRFEGHDIFYTISCVLFTGYYLDGIYFPNQRLLISLNNNSRKLHQLIHKLKFTLVANISKVASYLENTNPSRIVVAIGSTNFAHHLYNELEAVQRITQNSHIQYVDEFWVSHEPLGRIDDIFDEVPSNKIKRIQKLDIFNDVISSNSLVVRIGDRYVSDSLKNRIYKAALKNSSKDLIENIKLARSSCDVILWVSLRLLNRTCVNQEDAIANIISHLSKDCKQLGVVFDGFSLPVDFDMEQKQYSRTEFGRKHIEGLNQVVHDINQRIELKNITYFNIVGCTLHEAILWAHNVDVYFCHHGTIQHKIGWFVNTPGVVHSNQDVLSDPIYPYAKGSWINCKDAFYLSEDSVRDDETPIQYKNDKRSDLNNYYLHWEKAYEVLCNICQSISH